jgi:hypothetical protein
MAAHQGFRVLCSGYKLLLANIGPSATLSRFDGPPGNCSVQMRHKKIRVRLRLGTWDEQRQACESTKRRSQACPGPRGGFCLPAFGLCCAVTLAVVRLLGLMHMLRVFLREVATRSCFLLHTPHLLRVRTSSYGGSPTTHFWRWHAR